MADRVPEKSTPGKHDPDLEATVLALIIGSVCWVEATGNEMFSTCAEHPGDPALAALDAHKVTAVGDYWRAKAGRVPPNSIEKWERLTKTLGKGKLDLGNAAVSEMALLVRLRNHCIHAKPSHWPTQDADDKDLEAKLRGRFPLNQYPESNTLFFPNEVLSAGCAEWAVKTAGEFFRYVYNLLGITPKFDLHL